MEKTGKCSQCFRKPSLNTGQHESRTNAGQESLGKQAQCCELSVAGNKPEGHSPRATNLTTREKQISKRIR